MGTVDYILIGVIAVSIIVAIILIIRGKKKGSCCGGCEECSQNCKKKN